MQIYWDCTPRHQALGRGLPGNLLTWKLKRASGCKWVALEPTHIGAGVQHHNLVVPERTDANTGEIFTVALVHTGDHGSLEFRLRHCGRRWGVGPKTRTLDPVYGKLQLWVNGAHPCRISFQLLLHVFLVAKVPSIITGSLHCISVNQWDRLGFDLEGFLFCIFYSFPRATHRTAYTSIHPYG